MKLIRRLMPFTFLFIISFFLLFTFCFDASAEALKAPEEIWSWVLAQPSIRIYFDNSAGVGHQSSSLRIVRKLLKEGYKGNFDFVALNDDVKEQTFSKVRRLMGPDLIQSGRIHWLSLDKLNSTSLAITGGNDRIDLRTRDFKDFYGKIKSKFLIVLQPPFWGLKNQILYENKTDHKKIEILQLGIDPLEIAPDLDDGFIADPKLEKLFQEFTVIPIYGHAQTMNHSLPTLIRATLEEYKASSLKKPLLFLALNQDAYLQSYKTQGVKLFSNDDFEKENGVEKLKAFSQGAPCVLNLAPLPQPIFDWLFKRAEYFSGVSGVNSEMTALKSGIPFLKIDLGQSLNDFRMRFPYSKDRKFINSRRVFIAAIEGFNRGDLAALKAFVKGSLDPDSEMHQFSKATRDGFIEKFGHDKLEVAFTALADANTDEFSNSLAAKIKRRLFNFKNVCERLLSF